MQSFWGMLRSRQLGTLPQPKIALLFSPHLWDADSWHSFTKPKSSSFDFEFITALLVKFQLEKMKDACVWSGTRAVPVVALSNCSRDLDEKAKKRTNDGFDKRKWMRSRKVSAMWIRTWVTDLTRGNRERREKSLVGFLIQFFGVQLNTTWNGFTECIWDPPPCQVSCSANDEVSSFCAFFHQILFQSGSRFVPVLVFLQPLPELSLKADVGSFLHCLLLLSAQNTQWFVKCEGRVCTKMFGLLGHALHSTYVFSPNKMFLNLHIQGSDPLQQFLGFHIGFCRIAKTLFLHNLLEVFQRNKYCLIGLGNAVSRWLPSFWPKIAFY